jgi:hypothetical protein
MRRSSPLVVGAALCLFTALATAQALAGPPADPLQPPADSAAAIEQVQGIVDALTGGIASLAAGSTPTATALKALGLRIAVSLFGVLLAWTLVKGWVLGKGLQQLLPDLMQPLLVLGLALWAVDGLAAPVEASVLAVGRVVAAALGADQVLNETGLLTTMGVSGLELLMTPVAHGLHPLDWLVGKLACLACALVLLLCGVIGAGTLVVAKFQTAVAILLAPVLIPWAMWPATSFVFNAWLGFLLAGAMTQAMVTIVAAMTTGAIDRLCAVVAGYADKEVSIVAFGALFLGVALIAWLFLSVPRLASGLVAGTALGLQGWSTAVSGAGRRIAMTMGAVTHAGRAADARHGMAGRAPSATAGTSRPAASGVGQRGEVGGPGASTRAAQPRSRRRHRFSVARAGRPGPRSRACARPVSRRRAIPGEMARRPRAAWRSRDSPAARTPGRRTSPGPQARSRRRA